MERLSGRFDLAVDGGGPLTVEYRKEGFLTAQRQLHLPWQDYRIVGDVVLVQADSEATVIDLTAGSLQVHRANPVTDADGSRQATVLFPAGTTAELMEPGGGAQPIDSLSVRVTEFTVGDNGPSAMPAELPDSSAYTYAAAFTVDETGSGESVRFNQPVPFYVENFLGFPTGIAVPLGNYDTEMAVWVAYESGRVIEVLAVAGGIAELDVDGSGLPASPAQLAALSIGEEERQQLATLYAPGQSLWRCLLPHFSFWDLNWPFTPPPDATFPPAPQGDSQAPPPPQDDFCPIGGSSVIECQNQTLGERIAVVGTPFSLNYRSDRVPGRTTSRRLEIPLSGPSLPASLRSIELEVSVAGQVFRESFPPDPNQTAVFVWDGRDAYGRLVQGQQPALVTIGYDYPGRYQAAERFGEAPFGSIIDNEARDGLTLRRQQTLPLGPFWDAREEGLGGWTLSEHHVYDPLGRVLYRGNGSRRSTQSLPRVIDLVEKQAVLDPRGVATGPDGSIYVADGQARRVRRILPDGTVVNFAGTGSSIGPLGDGGAATQARLLAPEAVAVGPDGSVFIADMVDHRIRRVNTSGIITTLAGVGTVGFGGDGGPANQAQLSVPNAVASAPDGNVYISDSNNRRVRAVTADGSIFTFAGNGQFGSGGDGGPAAQAQLREPTGLAVGPDGSVYIADRTAAKIRRVRPDGVIETFAGTGGFGSLQDGIPATQARLFGPLDVDVTPDEVVLIVELSNAPTEHRVRQVRADGIITTLAGGPEALNSGDGGTATAARLFRPVAVAQGPDGAVYIAATGRVRKVFLPLPSFTASQIALPSEDATEVYQFDSFGRHLRTVSGSTGALLLEFGYDAEGRLTTITDGDGNQTLIQRDPDGSPTAVVAPWGQITQLTLDADGHLASIIDPGGNRVSMTYSPQGLLESFEDARQSVTLYQYDELGRLTGSQDP